MASSALASEIDNKVKIENMSNTDAKTPLNLHLFISFISFLSPIKL